MTLPSSLEPPEPTNIRASLMFFAIISVFLIPLYFWRYLQVRSMRESWLQSREISYITTALTSSKLENQKNVLETPQAKLVLPLGVKVEPGTRLEVIGRIEKDLQPLKSEKIILTARAIRAKSATKTYGISSLYRVLKLLEEVPLVMGDHVSGFLESSQASLLVGMVFGGSQRLPKTVLEDMKVTGLSHITAASGFNVSILIGFSLNLFSRFLNRRRAVILSLITVISYSVMAGMTPPILRASLMGGLYLLSLLSGRLYSVWRSLFLATALMLIYQPFLIFSVSFQLTVASTLGLILSGTLWPAGTPKQGILPSTWAVLEENFKTTVSILLVTTPIMVSTFGTFSLVAPLANAILLWMVAPLTLVGLGFLPLAAVSPFLASLFSWPLSLVLEVFLRSVHVFSRLPLASLSLERPAWWGILGWYVCLAVYLSRRLAVKSSKR